MWKNAWQWVGGKHSRIRGRPARARDGSNSDFKEIGFPVNIDFSIVFQLSSRGDLEKNGNFQLRHLSSRSNFPSVIYFVIFITKNY